MPFELNRERFDENVGFKRVKDNSQAKTVKAFYVH